MQRLFMIALMSTMILTACSHQQDVMQTSLNKIRIMIKQSALLAVQAACVDEPGNRAAMTHAAAILGRRAMGGQEMAKIHKLMGKMQMKDDMAGKKSDDIADHTQTTEMKLHTDLHDAGEQVFSFLDSLGGNHSPSCSQVSPASLAASAAMLREVDAPEAIAAARKLDQSATGILDKTPAIPASVRTFALTLQRI